VAAATDWERGRGAGCTVIFTLLRLPGVTEQQFDEDARAVERDLRTLEALLERP
jgi:hypothetical protein